jgi:RHS repeat-associated protein
MDVSNKNRFAASASFSYDNVGNVTQAPVVPGGATQTYAYDAENKLINFNNGTAAYAYDGDGRRVEKIVGSTTTVFVYNVQGQLLAEYSSAATTGPGGTEYFTADHLGSTRVVTDASGAVISRHDYLSFGETIPTGIGGRIAGMGYEQPDGVEQKFTAKERDAETGLDNFGARYFGSSMGRFMSPDEFTGGPIEANGAVRGDPGPLPYADIANPQSLNKYTYTYNNPLRYIDPDGHEVVLGGSTQDKEEERKRLLANASKKGEAALFKTVTDKNGKTNLVLDKEAAANFQRAHSKGFNMLVQTVNSKNTVTVLMDNMDSRTTFQGSNATVFLNRNVAAIERIAPMRDAQGNVVPDPFNIIAGHEVLGHARLHLLGDPAAYSDGPGSKTFQIENQLRKEQGLPPRPDEAP